MSAVWEPKYKRGDEGQPKTASGGTYEEHDTFAAGFACPDSNYFRYELALTSTSCDLHDSQPGVSQADIDQTREHYDLNPYDDDEDQSYLKNSISNINAPATFGSVYGYRHSVMNSMASSMGMGRLQAADSLPSDKAKENLLFISRCLPDFTPIQKD